MRRYIFLFGHLLSPQVVNDGSNIRNEFKNAARQLVAGNRYDIFSPQMQHQTPEQIKQHIALKVGALLDLKTCPWVNNGEDPNASNAWLLFGFTHTFLRASQTTSSTLPWKKSSSARFLQRRGQLGVATWTCSAQCRSLLFPLRAVRYAASLTS